MNVKRKTDLTMERLLTFADSYESAKIDESTKVHTSVNVVLIYKQL